MAAEGKGNHFKDKGNEALRAGKFQEAVDNYTKALELEPENAVYYSNRSAAYAKLEDFNKSADDGQKAIELKPDWAKGYSRKAYALSKLGKYQETKETCEAGLRVDRGNQQLKDSLAEAERSLQGEAAMGEQEANPFASPEIWKKLVDDPVTCTYLQQDDYRMMLEQLRRSPSAIASLLHDYRIQKTLNVLLGVDIITPETASQHAQKQQEPTHPTPEAATSQANKEASKEEKSGDPDDPINKALQEKELGNSAYKKRDFEAALLHYSNAAKLDPTNMMFLTNRAAVHFEMGDYDHCIEDCQDAVTVGRDHRADFKSIAKAFARIGNACFKLKRWEDAVNYYDKSLTENRTDDVRKKRQQAEKLLEEEKVKAYINPEFALQEKEKGNACFQKGDFPTAMKHYTEAIKRNPEDAKLYSNRAACYTKLAEFRLGLQDCDQCIQLDPTFVKGYLRKGTILLALKDLVKAIQVYEKVLELDPENLEAKEGIMKCHRSGPASAEEVKQRAMRDPEIQEIFADPAMQVILRQMEQNPGALADHLKNPHIAQKIQKLVDAGLLQIR